MEAPGGCRKEAFVQALILIEQLYMAVNSIEDTLPQIPNFKKWPRLWSAVQSSMATFCDFLSSKGCLEKDDWKDRDMEIRIVLKKRT